VVQFFKIKKNYQVTTVVMESVQLVLGQFKKF